MGERRLLGCTGMVGEVQHVDIESRTGDLLRTRRHGGGTMR